MKVIRLIAAAGLTVVASHIPSFAGEPVPRTPPAPGLFRDQTMTWNREGWWAMRPEGQYAPNLAPLGASNLMPVEAQSVAIQNPVAKPFVFAIWDPKTQDWQQFEARPGRTDVTCPQCEGKAQLSFHNGREQSTYVVKLGRVVTIDWASAAGIWILSQDSTLVSPEGAVAAK